MNNHLSMRDIAERAGVSIATVSRYINQSGYVSQGIAVKIEKIINETKYVPNELARSVFRKHTKTIGVIVPNIFNPLFNQLIDVIEKYTKNYGYSIFLCNTQDDPTIEKQHISTLLGLRVGGIVTVRSHAKELYDQLDIPVIAVENKVSSNITTVSCDNYLGGEIAFNHLYECGCRNILHVRGPTNFEATEARYQGFSEAAKKNSTSVSTINFDTDFHAKTKLSTFAQFELHKNYDGIFVFNDITAATVLNYLVSQKINVPQDIQLIGFDDSFIGELVNPQLTTVHQPIEEMSEIIINQIFNLIKNPTSNKQTEDIIATPHLVVRQTTTPPHKEQ